MHYYIEIIATMPDEQFFKQENNNHRQNSVIYEGILAKQLARSQDCIAYSNDEVNRIILNNIRNSMSRRQNKSYLLFTDNTVNLLKNQWDYMFSSNPTHKQQIQQFVQNRNQSVYQQLLNRNLEIEVKYPIKPTSESTQHLQLLKGQSNLIKNKIININNSMNLIDGEGNLRNIYAGLYTEAKKKQYQEYMKRKQQERQKRHRKIQLHKKKQHELSQKCQEQTKQKQQQILNTRRQQYIQRQRQINQRRSQQQKTRQLRNSQYIRVRKSFEENPPLHQKLGREHHQKHQSEEKERRHRILSQNKERYRNIDELGLEEHERNYQNIKQMKQKERMRKLQELLEYHRNNHIAVEIEKRTDREGMEKQEAKQRYRKIKQYEEIVKQNFKPKINEDKRKEMLTLIEELQLNSRKLKKTKLKNGSVIYQEIEGSNPRELGIKYLQKTKQMATRSRIARSVSVNDDTITYNPANKPIDYLAQLKKKPKKYKSTLQSLLKKHTKLSYDQRLNKVESQSEKLQQITKQKQMQLKYCNFKDSDDILAFTEQIDKNYLDIAKVKLELIKQGNQ